MRKKKAAKYFVYKSHDGWWVARYVVVAGVTFRECSKRFDSKKEAALAATERNLENL
jgi:hypothetical protein